MAEGLTKLKCWLAVGFIIIPAGWDAGTYLADPHMNFNGLLTKAKHVFQADSLEQLKEKNRKLNNEYNNLLKSEKSDNCVPINPTMLRRRSDLLETNKNTAQLLRTQDRTGLRLKTRMR
jgi:hypothetical protein